MALYIGVYYPIHNNIINIKKHLLYMILIDKGLILHIIINNTLI